MTDSENSVAHDESDEDLYDDFPEFNFEEELAKLEGTKESYKQEAKELGDKVKQLTKEVDELKKLNDVLKTNLSTLLKTAKAEVQRKDSVIKELREKVESFTFRRNFKHTKEKYTTTEDLVFNAKNDLKRKSQIRSRSRTRSDSERKSTKGESRKFESYDKRGDDEFCDRNRQLNYLRYSKSRSRHSAERYNSRDRIKDNRWNYRDSVPDSKSYRYNQRDHLKYDSPDKKRYLDKSRYRRSSKDRREVSVDRRRRTDKRSRSRSRNRSVEKPKVVAKETKSKPSEKKNEDIRKSSLEKKVDVKTDRKDKTKKERKDLFETKSPLDVLYNEPLTKREVPPVVETPVIIAEPEEGECSENESTHSEPEDWKLSFKNERPAPSAPMTLYSKRMMQRLQKEQENVEKEKVEDKKPKFEALEETPKSSKVEKEPGELTDDENLVESSKEFQEIAKVASLQNDSSEKSPEDVPVFKEPLQKESKKHKEGEKVEVEEPAGIEAAKEIGDAVEFSPFKNNYKLIEISPIKVPTERRASLLDPPKSENQKEVENSIFSLLTSLVPAEKKEEVKTEEVVEKVSETLEKEPEKTESNDLKEAEKEVPEEKKSLVKGKRKGGAQKRKRKESENGSNESKKRKERRSRSKTVSLSEPEMPVEKVKEDISSFEFFKPITEKPANVSADYKMTMSVTGVVCLQTPNKCGEKIKNLMINEQMIVLDSRSGPFTPIISSKCVEMTPRRMLKNDLMLTDSEDESGKPEVQEAEENKTDAEDSEVDSDSGASDFVDLL